MVCDNNPMLENMNAFMKTKFSKQDNNIFDKKCFAYQYLGRHVAGKRQNSINTEKI